MGRRDRQTPVSTAARRGRHVAAQKPELKPALRRPALPPARWCGMRQGCRPRAFRGKHHGEGKLKQHSARVLQGRPARAMTRHPARGRNGWAETPRLGLARAACYARSARTKRQPPVHRPRKQTRHWSQAACPTAHRVWRRTTRRTRHSCGLSCGCQRTRSPRMQMRMMTKRTRQKRLQLSGALLHLRRATPLQGHRRASRPAAVTHHPAGVVPGQRLMEPSMRRYHQRPPPLPR
jgi:hypothetical protein